MISVAEFAIIVGRFTTLRRVGNTYVGRCPFPDHSDTHPSFVVKKGSDGDAWFHCSCGQHGGATAFLIRIEGKTWKEAQDFLAGVTKLPATHAQTRQRIAAVKTVLC